MVPESEIQKDAKTWRDATAAAAGQYQLAKTIAKTCDFWQTIEKVSIKNHRYRPFLWQF